MSGLDNEEKRREEKLSKWLALESENNEGRRGHSIYLLEWEIIGKATHSYCTSNTIDKSR